MTRLALFSGAAGVVLAAVASPAAADTKVAYSCDDGTIAVADFGLSEGRLGLTFGRRRIVLAPVKAPSGSAYTNGKTTFRVTGQTARLKDNGRETTCRVIED